ncbi:SGNH/GDSL hydrolase family protein [soil metagenome]
MKKIQLVFCILLLLSFAVNAQSDNTQKKQLNILTLGDSNGSFPFSWPIQLGEAIPNANVFNISKSGRTIGFLNLGDSSLNSLFVIDTNIKKAAAFIKDKSYNFIVIELGTNDAKAVFKYRQKEVPGNLEILINKIKHSTYASINGAEIIIISPPPFGAKAEATVKYKGGDKRVEKMSRAFKKIARRNNCLFINGYKTPGLDINIMTSDGIHLDETGSKKLIVPVVEAILSSAR